MSLVSDGDGGRKTQDFPEGTKVDQRPSCPIGGSILASGPMNWPRPRSTQSSILCGKPSACPYQSSHVLAIHELFYGLFGWRESKGE